MRTVPFLLALVSALASGCGKDSSSPSIASNAAPASSPLAWRIVRDLDDLTGRLAEAKATKTPVVVEAWAEWCEYCSAYDALIEKSQEIKTGLGKLSRLRIDVTQDPHEDLRKALGMGLLVQPVMVFIDSNGRPKPDLTIDRFYASGSEKELTERLRTLGVVN